MVPTKPTRVIERMYPRQSRERKHFHPIIPHPHARARAIAIPSTPKSEFPTAPRGAPGGADHFFTPSIAPHAVARRRDRPSNASNITHEISSIRVTAQTHRAARIDIETRRWMPSSRIRESLAAFEPSHPSPGRPVVPPRARSHPPERRAPNHAHATKHTHTHTQSRRTYLLLNGAEPHGRALRSDSSSGRTHRPVDTAVPNRGQRDARYIFYSRVFLFVKLLVKFPFLYGRRPYFLVCESSF